MKKDHILYIGTHPEIRETVVRLINSNNAWHGYGAADIAEAMRLLKDQPADLILLGTGISPDQSVILRALMKQQKPPVPIVQHYGGGSGLLQAEILFNLQKRK